MKKILIFAGTTEGRKLSECLEKAQIFHTMCVATEYGEIVLHENPYVKIHQGRMDQEEMRTFILDGKYAAVVDATQYHLLQRLELPVLQYAVIREKLIPLWVKLLL